MRSCMGSRNSRKSPRLDPTQINGFKDGPALIAKDQYSDFTIPYQGHRLRSLIEAEFDAISVSAGARRMQLVLKPADYLAAVNGIVGGIARSKR